MKLSVLAAWYDAHRMSARREKTGKLLSVRNDIIKQKNEKI